MCWEVNFKDSGGLLSQEWRSVVGSSSLISLLLLGLRDASKHIPPHLMTERGGILLGEKRREEPCFSVKALMTSDLVGWAPPLLHRGKSPSGPTELRVVQCDPTWHQRERCFGAGRYWGENFGWNTCALSNSVGETGPVVHVNRNIIDSKGQQD